MALAAKAEQIGRTPGPTTTDLARLDAARRATRALRRRLAQEGRDNSPESE